MNPMKMVKKAHKANRHSNKMFSIMVRTVDGYAYSVSKRFTYIEVHAKYEKMQGDRMICRA